MSNPRSTSNVYVTPARAVVETTWEIVALMRADYGLDDGITGVAADDRSDH